MTTATKTRTRKVASQPAHNRTDAPKGSKAAAPAPPATKAEARTTKEAAGSRDSGTQRWHPETMAPGEWIKLPKALIKGTGRLKLKPHHVWLLLALQLEQYRKH